MAFAPSSTAVNRLNATLAQGYAVSQPPLFTTYIQPIGPTLAPASVKMPQTRLSAVPSSRLSTTSFQVGLDSLQLTRSSRSTTDYRDDYGDEFLPAYLLEKEFKKSEDIVVAPGRSQSQPEQYQQPKPKRIVSDPSLTTCTAIVPEQLRLGEKNPEWLEEALYGPAYLSGKSSTVVTHQKGENGTGEAADDSEGQYTGMSPIVQPNTSRDIEPAVIKRQVARTSKHALSRVPSGASDQSTDEGRARRGEDKRRKGHR
ncbi:hypothetical protein OIO90_001537 [Microbotryomycetes sp. JL221]|nr:hypothetical protein OIO90_001537 [Microbotryomycetes sp. JL221]